MFSISICRSKTDHHRFERLPELLHRTDPSYIPPVPGDIKKYLKSDSLFHRLHGEICAWIAWRNGAPVGRIAAIVNRSHNSYYNDRVGFFGFFDCEKNPETSRALFAEVKKFLRDKGLTHIRGPYNPSVNEECGLLVDSFDLPAFIGMPWNPAYYEELILDAGFVSVRELYAYLLSSASPMPTRVARVVHRLTHTKGWKFRNVRLKKLKEDLMIVQQLYNKTLDRNWGFVPIVSEDLFAAAEGLKMAADPELINFAEKNGEAVGFAVCLPNLNQLLAKTKKTPPGVLRLLHLFWLMKTQRPNQCRLAILGVVPEYRDRGISAWLFYEQLSRIRGRYQTAELSWIEESNREVMQSIDMMGGKKYRTYRIYEK